MLDILPNDFLHIHLSETDSTNRFAMDLASKTSPTHGICIYSDYQTDGKGQFGRIWDSDRGLNILSSFILQRPDVQPESMFSIHLWITLSLIDALQKAENLEYQIKWPNDIMVRQKKLAGILIENSFKGNELNYCVAGIGVNVHQQFFSPNYKACSLQSETGHTYSIEKILYTLQKSILSNESLVKRENIPYALEQYNKKLYQKNQICSCKNKEGEFFDARIMEVDIDGNLGVEVKDKILRFAHREIIIIE